MADEKLVPFQNNLTGRCIKSVDAAKIEFQTEDQRNTVSDNFSELINMKYSDNGITGVTRGMTKVNTTALSSYPLIRTAFHFKKAQPNESHVLVQAWNAGQTASKVYHNMTAVPTAGDFDATALHTDASGATYGRLSSAPDEHVVYCNGVETKVWGGNATKISSFSVYDPSTSFTYDYTKQVQNTLSDSDNIATLKQVDGIGAETQGLYHFEDTTPFQDDSPGADHPMTGVNSAERSTVQKKFNAYSAAMANATSDYAVITQHADFDFRGGNFTFEGWRWFGSAVTIHNLFSHAEQGFSQDYMTAYVDTNNAVKFEIWESDVAGIGDITLTGGASGSVDTVTVNGVTITSGAVVFDTDLDTTAINLAANITAHTSAPNYTAVAASSVVTITPDRMGADSEGFVVNSTVTTITRTHGNITGGSNSAVVSMATPNAVVVDGEWVHLRICEKDNDFYIFVNGIQRAHVSSTNRTGGAQVYTSNVFINVEYDGANLVNFGDGYWDEVRITNNALSTSSFEVPTAAYDASAARVVMRVGNTLPIEAINFTVSNANASAGTMTVFYWASGAWNTVTTLVDGTVVGGIPLAQSGSVTFDSTADTAKPSIIDGIMGYWYKVEITNADETTAISHLTVTEPWQDLKDFWDGEFRVAPSVLIFEDNINKDATINVKDDSFIYVESTGGNTATYMKMDELETLTEYLQVGFHERQQGLRVKMIPEHSNQSTQAYGTIVFNDDSVDINDTITSLTVDGVELLATEVRAANTDDITHFARLLIDEINDNNTSPNYSAVFEDNVVIITADAHGSAQNGFVIVVTDGGQLNNKVTPFAKGVDYTSTLTVYYWDGKNWITVGDLRDGTIDDNNSMAKSGFITWDPIAENVEFKKSITEEDSYYYYKLAWSEKFSPDVKAYYIAGVPVQRQISNYKFPLHAQGRLWLFSDQAGDKNSTIVSNLNELNSFNGVGVGDPFYFGDKTEIIAATEMYERTSTQVESHILVLKHNSIHIVEGTNPENWKTVNLTDNIGCNAPYTLAKSSLGIESSPLQRRQVAIWQGSSGLYMFDNHAVHPISDDIGYYFDHRNADAINLAYAHISYGFFTIVDGEHFYHWCFASGTSTVLDKEWVLDIKRQRWFEVDRGTGKAIQGGVQVLDPNGNAYSYGFEDTGHLQRLNWGTTYDGNDMVYTFATGDVLPAGSVNVLTSVDSIRMATISKENTGNNILAYHYGDTKDVATTDQRAKTAYYSLNPANTGSRLSFPFKRVNTPPHMTHKLKFVMTTNNKTVGFEPLYVGGFYKPRGHSELNITD